MPTCLCRLRALCRGGQGVGIQGDLQAAMQGGEDGGGLRGARVLRPQREQVVDVLGLEEALLLRVAQHLLARTERFKLILLNESS